MTKKIFKFNALVALGYTVFFVCISFLFGNTGQAIILEIIYSLVACIHFMIMGILMAINHFQLSIDKRNGYMASFGFIWLLLLIVNVARFLF